MMATPTVVAGTANQSLLPANSRCVGSRLTTSTCIGCTGGINSQPIEENHGCHAFFGYFGKSPLPRLFQHARLENSSGTGQRKFPASDANRRATAGVFLLERTVEGELLPMAQEFGLGITPYSPLKFGILSGKYTRDNLNEAMRDVVK